MIVVVPIILALVGTFMSAAGYTFQKIAHLRADAAERGEASRFDYGTDESPPGSPSPAPVPAPAPAPAAGTAAVGPVDILNVPEDGGAQDAVTRRTQSTVIPRRHLMIVRSASARITRSPLSMPDHARTISLVDVLTDKPKPSYWKYWQFPTGLALLIAGSVFSVFVLGLADQAQMAPMGACTLVYNSILAHKFLGEPLTLIDYVSSSFMIAGTTVALIFVKTVEEKLDLHLILDLIDRTAWGVGAGCLAAVIAGLVAMVAFLARTPITALSKVQLNVDCFGRSVAAGLTAGFTSFTTKAVTSVVFDAVRKHSAKDLGRWEFYAMVVVLPICLYTQVGLMNSGLARHDSVSVIPLYQSTLVLAGVFSGWVFYNELRAQDTKSIAFFLFGTGLTCIGIALLLFKPRRDMSDVEEGDSPSVPLLSSPPQSQSFVRKQRQPMSV